MRPDGPACLYASGNEPKHASCVCVASIFGHDATRCRDVRPVVDHNFSRISYSLVEISPNFSGLQRQQTTHTIHALRHNMKSESTMVEWSGYSTCFATQPYCTTVCDIGQWKEIEIARQFICRDDHRVRSSPSKDLSRKSKSDPLS